MIPKCRLACLFRFLMVFRRRRERKNFISKICKIWEQTNCWIVFGCIIHIWCTPQAPQILSKFLHKTVKIYLLSDIYRGVTLRCCGVHGYYLDFFISDLWNTRPLLLWFYTKHFHTALKYLPFFLKKKKKRNEDHHLHSEFIILSFFLARFWWQKKKETTECGGLTSFFSQYAIVPNIFLSACSLGAVVFYLLLRQKGAF